MKTLISIIAILSLTISVTAQRQISDGFTEITRTQFDSCSKVSFLVTNMRIKKQAGRLTVPVYGKPAMVFKDDKSDQNFHQFEYLGDIKGTKLSLLKRIDYNSEEFYLINRSTGGIDTLIGLPVFAHNMQDFACINNPGTDERQQIQVFEIKNGFVKRRGLLNGKADIFLESISCINRNSILVKDNKDKYWKLIFKIGEK